MGYFSSGARVDSGGDSKKMFNKKRNLYIFTRFGTSTKLHTAVNDLYNLYVRT